MLLSSHVNLNNQSEIRTVPASVATPFIEKWHYSHRCPTGLNLFFGWYIKGVAGLDQVDLFGQGIYAVADYGIGVNPYQARSLSKIVGIEIDGDKLLELKRICRIEPKLSLYPLTQFITGCHKLLKLAHYYYVVSFSDPAHGHTGGLYKAANFTYLGKTNAETHALGIDGIVRHRRFYYRYARRNKINMEQARKELGLTLTKTVPKDRWFIIINHQKAKNFRYKKGE